MLYVPRLRLFAIARLSLVSFLPWSPMISIFFLAVLGIVLFEVGVTCLLRPRIAAIAVAISAITSFNW